MKNIYILILAIFTSCANIVPPTGGPKDEQGPKLVSQYPLNNTLNFTSKTLVLEFDESIEAKNLNTKILISPTYNGELDYKVKGKKIEIVFKDSLDANTTYTVNYNDAITDITEYTKTNGEPLVFSTGNILDSATIKGKVINPYTNSNTKMAIYAYTEIPDFEKKPLYITYTNDEGSFEFKGLKKQNYYLIAIDDKNSNFKIDYTEEAGFTESAIECNLENEILIETFPYSKPISFKKAREEFYKDYFIVEYSQKIKKVEGLTTKLAQVFNSTITFDNSLVDSMYTIKIYSIDNQVLNDTITVKTRDKNSKKLKTEIEYFPKPSKYLKPSDTLSIQIAVNKPIKLMNIDKISLIQNKDTLKGNDKTITIKKVQNQEIVITNHKTIANKLDVKIGYGFVYTTDNDTLSQIDINYSTIPSNKYGKIKITVPEDIVNPIVQILDEKMRVEEEIFYQQQIQFNYVETGTKWLRIISDLNKNGKWDEGSVIERRKSEPITFSVNPIVLKSNWEIENVVFNSK